MDCFTLLHHTLLLAAPTVLTLGVGHALSRWHHVRDALAIKVFGEAVLAVHRAGPLVLLDAFSHVTPGATTCDGPGQDFVSKRMHAVAQMVRVDLLPFRHRTHAAARPFTCHEASVEAAELHGLVHSVIQIAALDHRRTPVAYHS
eukprot:649726-Amorphochlora_amoeboformis.AAC.1